jgi:eukaryotic-like serine/threonine-protein kinase
MRAMINEEFTPGSVVRGTPYIFRRVLGSGTQGQVLLVEAPELGGHLAMKVLHATAGREAVERFRQETRLLFALRHPALAQVHHASVLPDGRPYFLMDHVDGESLLRRLRTQGRLPPREALLLMAEVCDALEVAHRAGVVHRDVKPGNILLTTEGRPKLIDFGVAKRLTTTSLLTAKNSILGTAAYLAPEQIRQLAVSSRTDLYAVGGVLFAALTGRPPFDLETEHELMVAHVHEQPRRLSDVIGAAVPPAVETVVQQLLAKDPHDRPASAAVVAERLRRIAADLPVAGPTLIAGAANDTAMRQETAPTREQLSAEDSRREFPSPRAQPSSTRTSASSRMIAVAAVSAVTGAVCAIIVLVGRPRFQGPVDAATAPHLVVAEAPAAASTVASAPPPTPSAPATATTGATSLMAVVPTPSSLASTPSTFKSTKPTTVAVSKPAPTPASVPVPASTSKPSKLPSAFEDR